MSHRFKNPFKPQIKKDTTVFRAVELTHHEQERVGFPTCPYFRHAFFSIKRIKLGCSNRWWFGYKRVFTKIVYDVEAVFTDIDGKDYEFHWMSTASTLEEAIDNCVTMFIHQFKVNRYAKKLVETTAL